MKIMIFLLSLMFSFSAYTSSFRDFKVIKDLASSSTLSNIKIIAGIETQEKYINLQRIIIFGEAISDTDVNNLKININRQFSISNTIISTPSLTEYKVIDNDQFTKVFKIVFWVD